MIFGWQAKPSVVPSDHWMISVKFAPKDAPLIENGRWTWYLPSINEKPLIDKIILQEIDLQRKLDNLETGVTTRNDMNPQTLWENFKMSLQRTAKNYADKSRYKLVSKLKCLENDRKELTEDPNFNTDGNLRARESFIEHEIKHLQNTEAKISHENLRAAITHHGEKIGGIWSAINKEKKPRNLIRHLQSPGTNQYERSSVRMAELARNYHKNLQNIDPPQPDRERRSEHIQATLEAIPTAQKLNEPRNSPTNGLITESNVEKALGMTKNNSATGMDGCLLRSSPKRRRSRILMSKGYRVKVSHVSVNPSCRVSKWTKS